MIYKGDLIPIDIPMQLWSADSRYPTYYKASTISKFKMNKIFMILNMNAYKFQ